MRLWLLSLLLVSTSLLADYTRQNVDAKLLSSGIKIIDIRTPSEWKTTGLLKGSIPITFFDDQGNYNLNAFVGELDRHVKKNERFALICNSGNRTKVVGTHLGTQMGYNVIDLAGGIQSAVSQKLPLEPYRR